MSKTILITGAATRIGRHLALGLAKQDWHVLIHYHSSEEQAASLIEETRSFGGKTDSLKADLHDPAQVSQLIDRAAHMAGTPLNALINNASIYQPDLATDFQLEQLNRQMRVNLDAPLILARDFARQLPVSYKGCIINMIDQRVLRPAPDFFTYTLSKQALYAATKTLAQALAPNIRVNAVGPGPTLPSVYQTDAEFQREVNATLLKTGSPPDSILQAVQFLLDADAVTGQMIAVDGGQHLEV